MALPTSLTFSKINGQYFSWGPLVDGLDFNATPSVVTPITDYTVTATLYKGRSHIDPDLRPGTPDSTFHDLALPHITGGAYRCVVPALFDADVNGSYVTVIDATNDSREPQHWEIPTFIKVRND